MNSMERSTCPGVVPKTAADPAGPNEIQWLRLARAPQARTWSVPASMGHDPGVKPIGLRCHGGIHMRRTPSRRNTDFSTSMTKNLPNANATIQPHDARPSAAEPNNCCIGGA